MQDIEIFDTLGVSKKFREVGIPAEQAEVLVAEMAKLATKQPVSHQDLRQTEEKLLDEIKETEERLRGEIKETEEKLRDEIKASEQRVMSWVEVKFEAVNHRFDAMEHKIDARINRQTLITIGGVAALLAIFQFLVPILS